MSEVWKIHSNKNSICENLLVILSEVYWKTGMLLILSCSFDIGIFYDTSGEWYQYFFYKMRLMSNHEPFHGLPLSYDDKFKKKDQIIHRISNSEQ